MSIARVRSEFKPPFAECGDNDPGETRVGRSDDYRFTDTVSPQPTRTYFTTRRPRPQAPGRTR